MQSYARDQVVLTENSPGKEMFIVCSGHVLISSAPEEDIRQAVEMH
jgi:hypothetical protein